MINIWDLNVKPINISDLSVKPMSISFLCGTVVMIAVIVSGYLSI